MEIRVTQSDGNIPNSLQPVSDALQQSMRMYEHTCFTARQEILLKAFVDIIHDDYSLDRFFQVCVTVPLILNGFQAGFYLYENKKDRFLCVCNSQDGLLEPPRPADPSLTADNHLVHEFEDQLVHPLYPRAGGTEPELRTGQAGTGLYDPDPYFVRHTLLGLYTVSPAHQLSKEDRLFFELITRWMGNKLNNRLIANRHMEHLQFLNDLGRDIGHNIIVPNMFLKHLLRQMEKQIESLKDIEREAEAFDSSGITTRQYVSFLHSCREKALALELSHRELLRHHNQISLFLESLFREQHFSQGHLVLKPTSCFVERDIILPQLELYQKKLKRQGITVDKPVNLYKQKFPLMVDIGLLSQVYANLFSNAVKYTEEIIDHQGKPRKAMAYGAEKIKDFPEPGRKGIKFNVFTTGPPLSETERLHVFEEGRRAENSKGISGSGHGLNFIRRVIEVHGGKVGCEATDEGNNFYFILPISLVEQ
jgi:signal transduction histidine kinase